jgi:hypothetical protein
LREIHQILSAANLLYSARERIPAGVRIVSGGRLGHDDFCTDLPPLSHDEACWEIAIGFEALFEPAVVQAFERVLEVWNPDASTMV